MIMVVMADERIIDTWMRDEIVCQKCRERHERKSERNMNFMQERIIINCDR